MNRFLAIVLSLCLSCQCVLKLSIYAWFKLNQEYIATTLCENKNRPELVCCGKCVLSKKLDSVDGSERNNPKQQPSKRAYTESTTFVLPESTVLNPASIPDKTTPQNGSRSFLRAQSPLHQIFHPPTI